MSKIFIDTNIIVYSIDAGNIKKRDKCRAVLREANENYTGVISTQVMQELYVAGTKKLGVDPLVMKGILRSLQHFEAVLISPDIIEKAIDCSILNQISFWDSLIVASAESAKCEELWTEDLNPGQIINGVKIVNPLAL